MIEFARDVCGLWTPFNGIQLRQNAGPGGQLITSGRDATGATQTRSESSDLAAPAHVWAQKASLKAGSFRSARLRQHRDQ